MSASGLLDAAPIPALAYKGVVEDTESIVKGVQDLQARDLKEFIPPFFTGVLIIIPGVGEALSAEMAITRSMPGCLFFHGVW